MNTKSSRDIVMERVNKIYKIRKLVHPIRLKVFLFLVGLVGTAFSVSVPQVFENMFGRATLFGYFEYLANAFLHTEHFVQVACLLMLVAGALYCRDVYANTRSVLSNKF